MSKASIDFVEPDGTRVRREVLLEDKLHGAQFLRYYRIPELPERPLELLASEGPPRSYKIFTYELREWREPPPPIGPMRCWWEYHRIVEPASLAERR